VRAAIGAIFLLATVCAAQNQWIVPIVGKAEVELADSIEKQLRAQCQQKPPVSAPWFSVITGTVPVIITAPHAASPLREGQQRFPDKGTGSLALMLHRLTGTTVIYTSWASPCDPNQTDSCAFKDSLAKRLLGPTVLVIDLHTSHASRPYDIDFGTMKGISLGGNQAMLTKLSSTLSQHGLTVQSLDFFAADEKKTVTRFVAAKKIPALQLEINATWLRPDGNDLDVHRFSQLLNALTLFVRSITPSPAAVRK
jgi:hypothetical protein